MRHSNSHSASASVDAHAFHAIRSAEPTIEQVLEPIDTTAALSVLSTQVQVLQSQLKAVHQRLDGLERRTDREVEAMIPLPRIPRHHNPIISIAIQSVKFLFLLLFGFAIAFLLAAGLDVTPALQALQLLLSAWFQPLLTLGCIAIAISVVLESLK
jgi:hypothetical protein